MTTKSALSALGANVTGLGAREPRVEGVALPKSSESGNLSLNQVGIRWMSDADRREQDRSGFQLRNRFKRSRCADPFHEMHMSKRLRTFMSLVVLLALCTALVSAPTPAMARVRHWRPPVPSNCSRDVDVAKAFNEWLATVPDGATIDLKRNGCYLVKKTTITEIGEALIVFVNRHDITINGHGATSRPHKPWFQVTNVRSCTSSTAAASSYGI